MDEFECSCEFLSRAWPAELSTNIISILGRLPPRRRYPPPSSTPAQITDTYHEIVDMPLMKPLKQAGPEYTKNICTESCLTLSLIHI